VKTSFSQNLPQQQHKTAAAAAAAAAAMRTTKQPRFFRKCPVIMLFATKKAIAAVNL